VEVVGHADGDDIHILISKKVLVMSVNLGLSKFVGKLSGALCGATAYGGQKQMRVVPDGLGMFIGDLAGSPNAHTHLFFFGNHPLLSLYVIRNLLPLKGVDLPMPEQTLISIWAQISAEMCREKLLKKVFLKSRKSA
jgi:hypothetical protein